MNIRFGSAQYHGTLFGTRNSSSDKLHQEPPEVSIMKIVQNFPSTLNNGDMAVLKALIQVENLLGADDSNPDLLAGYYMICACLAKQGHRRNQTQFITDDELKKSEAFVKHMIAQFMQAPPTRGLIEQFCSERYKL